MKRLICRLLQLFLLFTLIGCQSAKSKSALSTSNEPEKLKVGITADTPPLAYKKEGTITGLETKFAAGLADFSKKKVELVELPRPKLSQALLNKKIDIIMSGLTAAEAQEKRLATTMPYLVTGQIPLIHLDAYKQLGSDSHNLAGPNVRLGVVAGTPGEKFIKGLNPQGKTTRFSTASEGVQALTKDNIDAFIYEMTTNFYYASLYIEQGFTPGVLMTHEPLVWGVNPKNKEMLATANEYLASIQQNGELEKMLGHSIPFYQNTPYSPKK